MSFHNDGFGRLTPQTATRLAREVRDLLMKPESGVRLIVDEATGLPNSLQELTVRRRCGSRRGPSRIPQPNFRFRGFMGCWLSLLRVNSLCVWCCHMLFIYLDRFVGLFNHSAVFTKRQNRIKFRAYRPCYFCP
jgi:hypothetical protein